MATILDIPLEVLSKILENLKPRDIVSVSMSCRILYRATKDESFWKTFCEKDYGREMVKPQVLSYREFYTKFLHRFGKLIGLWQLEAKIYGGLLQVQYEDGRLVGKEFYSLSDSKILDPLGNHLLFSLEFDKDGQLLELCLAGCEESHNACITAMNSDQFSFKCCDTKQHGYEDDEQEYLDWANKRSAVPIERREVTLFQDLLSRKFENIKLLNYCYEYQRLNLQGKVDCVPIQPGIFKGDYGGHGVELMYLTYDESLLTVKAIKITGDPNVPAQEITFYAGLNLPMNLTVEDQGSVDSLLAVPTVEKFFDKERYEPESQPFFLSPDISDEGNEVPATCIGRFHGWGQIADDGFQDPSFCQGHWIIFNENVCAFIWLEISSIGFFYRVRELP